MGSIAYIGLGSNLGDRQNFLDQAVEALQEHENIEVRQVSTYFETAPVGGPPGQPAFINAAAKVETTLEPPALMQALLEIEKRLGRVRGEKDGPRTIDLDILLYGDAIVESSDLTI